MSKLPVLEHLAELRKKLLLVLLIWLGIFIVFAFFSSELYNLIASPVISRLPQGGSLVAVDVTSPFIAPLKLAAFLSIFVALPLVFYQGWSFIAPGLYEKERELVLPLIFATAGFFYFGVLFVYFVVLPLALNFFYSVAPEGVLIMTDINRYLSFFLSLALIFGVAFEMPLAIVVLVRSKLVKVDWLRKNRSYFIVACFVAAMLLTPPDVFSQLLLAIPLCLLYEAGILLSIRAGKKELK